MEQIMMQTDAVDNKMNSQSKIVKNQITKMDTATAKLVLQEGEIAAILKGITSSKQGKYKNNDKCYVENNSIFLAKNDYILLRTNGYVNTGLYDPTGTCNFSKRDGLLEFTHDVYNEKYRNQVFVKGIDFKNPEEVKLKKTIFEAYYALACSNSLIKTKRHAVRFVLTHPEYFGGNIDMNIVKDTNKAKKESKQLKTEGDSKVINNVKIEDMKVMAIAHMIRKELELEGAYAAQMSYALKLAWKVKKGEENLNNVLGVAATDFTYNVAKNNVEDKAEDKVEDKIEDKAEDNVKDKASHAFKYYYELNNEFKKAVLMLEDASSKKAFPLTINGQVCTQNTGSLMAAYVSFGKENNLTDFLKNVCKEDSIVTIAKKTNDLIQMGAYQEAIRIQKEKNIKFEVYNMKKIESNKKQTADINNENLISCLRSQQRN